MMIPKGSERYKTAERLLEAAHDFWKACNKEGQPGAIQWLNGSNGELIIFTRFEYKDQILQNVCDMHFKDNVNIFAEYLEGEDDEE